MNDHADEKEPSTPSRPSWDVLYAVAEGQAGHFTTAQAACAGYSSQLLRKYLTNGRVRRVRRGVYRLVHFPASENEDLVVLWLWSEQLGVFSHETALILHDLSNVLPTQVHMIVPASWRRRRLHIPEGLVFHHANLEDSERDWMGTVPITSHIRTLRDCIDAHISPELVREAIRRARQRELISKDQTISLTGCIEEATRV